jgi:hypothetical protein
LNGTRSALWASLSDDELHLLVGVQGTETLDLDLGLMDKHIRLSRAFNEAVALLGDLGLA